MSTENLTGLTSAEVSQRVALGQVNRVKRSDLADYLGIVVRNVLTLFNAMVVPAAVVLFALGDVRAALAVSGFALTNTLLGLAQEMRAKWHLEHLALLAQARGRVLRDGQVIEVRCRRCGQGRRPAAFGPAIPSWLTVPSCRRRFLEMDEALLTGESDPVPRKVGEQVLSGSFCVAGDGAYRAERVGLEAFAQKTSSAARSYRPNLSPMQKSINRLIADPDRHDRCAVWTYLALYCCAAARSYPSPTWCG